MAEPFLDIRKDIFLLPQNSNTIEASLFSKCLHKETFRRSVLALRHRRLDLLLPGTGDPVVGEDLLGLEGEAAGGAEVARGERVLSLQVVSHVVSVPRHVVAHTARGGKNTFRILFLK